MARRRASMREGPLAELFRATEAAQRQGEGEPEAAASPATEPEERTVEHVPSWEEASAPAPSPPTPSPPTPSPPTPSPDPLPPPPMPDPVPPTPSPEPRPDPLPPEPPPQMRTPAPPPPVTRYADPLPESPARLHRVPLSDAGSYLAVIKVVGVGGAGLNAVNRMIDAGINQVEFIGVNTDLQALQMSDAPVKISIGRELTQGLGSGAEPDVGRAAAEEGYDHLKQAL